MIQCFLKSYVEQENLRSGYTLTLQHEYVCRFARVPQNVNTFNDLRIRTTDSQKQLTKNAKALNVALVIPDEFGNDGCVVYGLHQGDSSN